MDPWQRNYLGNMQAASAVSNFPMNDLVNGALSPAQLKATSSLQWDAQQPTMHQVDAFTQTTMGLPLKTGAPLPHRQNDENYAFILTATLVSGLLAVLLYNVLKSD